MNSADRKLKKQFETWRSVCPEDVGDTADIAKATTVTDKMERELESAQAQFKRKSTDYEDITADDVSEMLESVQDYREELDDLGKRMDELKRWLARVKTSSNPLPFALVVKGNSKADLRVHKLEKAVERGARKGKQEISGGKIFEGECQYKDGKLVFKFDGRSRAPWKMVLQEKVNQAGVNMKVALDGEGEDDTPVA